MSYAIINGEMILQGVGEDIDARIEEALERQLKQPRRAQTQDMVLDVEEIKPSAKLTPAQLAYRERRFQARQDKQDAYWAKKDLQSDVEHYRSEMAEGGRY